MMTLRNQVSPIVQGCVLLTRYITLSVFLLYLTACHKEPAAMGTPSRQHEVASEQGEQSVFYHDMLDAYERGDYDRARQLARKYLAPMPAILSKGGTELDVERGFGWMLTVLHSMLLGESQLPPRDRFGDDPAFVEQIEGVILAVRTPAHAIKAAAPQYSYAQRELKYIAREWILARAGHASRGQLEKLYRAFEPELRAQGLNTLDAVLQYQALEHSPSPTVETVDQVEAHTITVVIRDYFAGLVAKDLDRLESATGLDTETCSKFLDAYHEDCAEEGIASITNITLPALSREDLQLRPDPKKQGFYTLTIKGIRIDAVRVDGSAVSQVISKHLTLREQATGRWIIVAPQR